MWDLEALLDDRIVSRFYADSTGRGPYRFRWVNLVPRDEQTERQAEVQDLNAGLLSVNEVRARRDMRAVKDPLDRDRYNQIVSLIERKFPEVARSQDKLLDLAQRLYEEEGGEWAMWPDAPASPALLQVWQQEHQQDLGPAPEQEGAVQGQEEPVHAADPEARAQSEFQQEQAQGDEGQAQEPEGGEEAVQKAVAPGGIVRLVLKPAQALGRLVRAARDEGGGDRGG